MENVSRSSKTFVIAAVAVSLGVWDFAFNMGAYNTVFFDRLFRIWVISLAIVLAILVLPAKQRPITGWRLFALASPTLWVILTVIQQMLYKWSRLDDWVFILGGLVVFISLPYNAYVLVSVTQSETLSIRPQRLFYGLVGIAVIVGLLGYFMGAANYYLLSCEDFKLAGYDQPVNCWTGSQ
ncbi:MAG: hypothetical protein AAF629_11585 [Chloroflexota bacterium]